MNFVISTKKNKCSINLEKIVIEEIDEKKSVIFKSYQKKICNEKSKIDELVNIKSWDKMKKIGNPNELIYTSYNNKKKESIANYRPISRSFFKLWEIDKEFDLLENNNELKIIGNLAEGPGGFMEEIIHNHKNVKLFGITLPPSNNQIPKWNKNLKKNNYINITYGNLYDMDDIKNYINKFKDFKCSLVTADGGFDYSSDFNKQEVNSYKIIFSEVITSLLILKEGGNFVCKIFDTFTIFSIQTIYLLTEFFEEVNIYKPNTSRPANSEKYIICKGFLKNNNEFYLLSLLENVLKINMKDNKSLHIKNLKIPKNIIMNIFSYNDKYINFQIKYIKKILKLAESNIEKNELKEITKKQVKNAIDWCIKYDMMINKDSWFYKVYKNN